MMYIETIIGKPKTEMPHYTNDAMELLAKLADYGDRNAQKMLGWHYLNGILVKKDAQKAESISDKEKIRWLKVVAEQGDLDAQVVLADIYCNQKEELKWRKMAAEQGDLLAQNRLGYLYESGRIVERDYSEALIWYRKSREIDESQERISYFYEFGLGVDKDERLAYLWGKIAAENENPDAIERLSGLLKYQDM